MSDKLTVTIVGTNGVSRVFQEVVNDAQKMGTGIERSSQMADQALQGVGRSATQMAETVATSATEASTRAESIGSAIGKAGLAFGGFSLLADKAAADSAASLVQVQTAFQGAGLAIEDYQGQLNTLGNTAVHLGFDDEDAQNSLAKILTITKDVTKSFNDVRLAEDIARGSGRSLAEATSLVAAAESGRTRGLVQLVGNLGSTATAQDYLAAAQQKYAGAADNYANTQAGAFDRMKVQISNDLEAAGAAMSRFQMPILALSSAATALGPLAGTIKEIANAEKTAELGGAALDLALGPVGLAAAALAAGAGIVYLATHTREYVSASEAAAAATTDLSHLLTVLASQASPKDATIITSLRDQFTGLITDAGQRQDVLQKLTDLSNYTLDRTVLDSVSDAIDLTQEGAYRSIEAVSGLTQAEVDYFDANKDGVLTINELNAALAQYQTNLDRLNADQAKEVSKDLDTLFTLPNVDLSKLNAALSGLATQFQAGQLTGDQFVVALDGMVRNFEPYITSAEDAAKANSNLASSSSAATTAIKDTQAAVQAQIIMYGASGSVVASYAESQRDSASATKDSTKAAAENTVAIVSNGQAVANQMGQYASVNQSLSTSSDLYQLHKAAVTQDTSALMAIGDAQRDVSLPANALTDAYKQQTQAIKDDEAATKAAAAAITDYRQRLGEVHMVVNDGANQFAKHATIAGNALDAGQQVVVGNTNAIGQQAQGVSDWANKLIGAQGTLAQIDDLLARGVIDTNEYNAAQEAGTSIFASNAAIQDDILKIQTDQAPLIATLTANQQHYMDTLAGMPAQQQLIELGYMDQTESAKALADQQLLLSAVSGELGDKGVETASRMIKASAEADPVLAAMLQDMGLITVGADGTITVNTDSVKGGKSDTDKLIDAVTTLADELAQIFGITVDHGSVSLADTAVGFLKDHVHDLDGSSAAVDVGVNDGASGTLQGIAQLLDALNGKSAFVTVYQNTVGSFQSVAAGLNRLGGVAGYADGGVVIHAAEAGAELLNFANGGSALALTDGLYNVPRGTYVDTAPATKGKVAVGGMQFSGPISLVFQGFQSQQQVQAQISELLYGGSR